MMRTLVLLSLSAATAGACAKAGEGKSCDETSDCLGDLVCLEGRCSIEPSLHEKMAESSGVALTAERAPVGGAARSGAVKVRSARAKEFAYAICAADERLIGGWCEPPYTGSGKGKSEPEHTSGGIAGHTERDTIGARWKCALNDREVTAHALCQKVAAAPSPAASPTPSPAADPAPLTVP